MCKILATLVMAAVTVAAMAGNKISLSTASGHPGDEVTVTASLANDDVITAIEVLVPLNDHVQYVPESATLNSERCRPYNECGCG